MRGAVAIVVCSPLVLLAGCATPLQTAIDNDDVSSLQIAIEDGGNVNGLVGMSNLQPLAYACSKGKFDSLKFLLKKGANVNAQSGEAMLGDGDSPLRHCIMSGREDMVDFLIAHGARVEKRALALAVKGGNLHIIKLLLQHRTPGLNLSLLEAIQTGNSEIVRAIVDDGAPIRSSDLKVAQKYPEIYSYLKAENEKRASRVMSLNDGSATAPDLKPAPNIVAESASTSSDIDQIPHLSSLRPDDFALVIGIEDYQSLPQASFSERDAQTTRQYFEAMGIPSRNIVSLSGSRATASKLKSYLEEWLPLNVKPTSTLFVYYSGHGAPDPASGDAYLMPWDSDPMFLKSTAYPLKQMYADLAKVKTKRTIVALDSCFSGAGGRSVLPRGARPLVVKTNDGVPAASNITVFAAATGEQITGSLEGQGHGIFTYYFLKGLSGSAKDSHGYVTPKSLYDYLKPHVQDEARRQNREQTPTLAGVQDDEPLAQF